VKLPDSAFRPRTLSTATVPGPVMICAGPVAGPVRLAMSEEPGNSTPVSAVSVASIQSLATSNVPLLPGDVVTALFAPYSFTALGATSKTEEVNFESRGITLAQALARSGGLIDARSNARGVFIFRFVPKTALASWPREPVKTTPEGMVPVAFRIDLSDPASFFLIQNFPMENRDVLYVSNAPITEINKFLQVLLSVAYPVIAVEEVHQ